MQADRLRVTVAHSPLILLTLPCCTISTFAPAPVLRLQSALLAGFAAQRAVSLITAIGEHFLARCQAYSLPARISSLPASPTRINADRKRIPLWRWRLPVVPLSPPVV